MNQKLWKQLLWLTSFVFLCLSLVLIQSVKATWVEPTMEPPSGNVAPPINEGPDAQNKVGTLQLGGLTTPTANINNLTADQINVSKIDASEASTSQLCLNADCRIAWPSTDATIADGLDGQLVKYTTNGKQIGPTNAISINTNNQISFNGTLGDTDSARLNIVADPLEEGLLMQLPVNNAWSAINIKRNDLSIFKVNQLGQVVEGNWNGDIIDSGFGGTGTGIKPNSGQILLGNSDGNYDVVATSSLGFSLNNLPGIVPVSHGGTGSSTIPTKGQILMADANGNYIPVSTSSLGIIISGGFGGTDSFWATSTSDDIYNKNSGNVGIGTSTPNALLHIYKGSGDNAELDIQSVPGIDNHWAIYQDRASEDLRFWNSDNLLTLQNDGRVGIGTTSPSSELTVAGNIEISGESSIYKYGGFPAYKYNGVNVIFASTTLSSYFFGDMAGGYSATGIRNTAVGAISLGWLTSGTHNSAVGFGSLARTSEGSMNTAVGHESLFDNRIGNRNVAVGPYALAYSKMDDNVAVGYQAGIGTPWFWDGASENHTVLDSEMTFLGAFASRDGDIVASTTPISKSVAIGYKAKVGGSNMMALGGIGVDAVNVGVGTSTPNSLLHIYKGSGNNAELDIQSVPGFNKHWAIYQDRASEDLRFWNSDNLLTLQNDGRVGIGTTSPIHTLDVNGDTRILGHLFDGANSAGTAGDVLQATANGFRWVTTSSLGIIGGSSISGVDSFWASSTVNVNDIHNKNSGNIGIGINNADVKLHILDRNSGPMIGLQGEGSRYRGLKIAYMDGLEQWFVGSNGAPDNFVIRRGGANDYMSIDSLGTSTFSGPIYAQAFLYTSDASLKTNIKPLDNALEKLQQINGVSFDWKKDGSHDLGVVAQNVEVVYPELVRTNPETGLKSVEYGNLVAPLIEAIKEQQKQIEELKADIIKLKSVK